MAYRPPRSERPSRRERSMNEYTQFQETQNQAAALDSQSQAALMQQLAAMYGIQGDAAELQARLQELELKRQMFPEQLALSKAELEGKRADIDLRQQLAPSQIALANAEAAYRQAVAAGYPEDIASIIAQRAATTEQTQTQTAGMQQQQGAFPDQNAAELALKQGQALHLGEQTKALGYENEYGNRNARNRALMLEGQLGMQPFEQQRLQLGNEQLAAQNTIIPEQLRGLQLANTAQGLQNDYIPIQQGLQTQQGTTAIEGALLQNELQRQQNAWFGPNQEQAYAQNNFDLNQMGPMKLKLGQEQLNASRGQTAMNAFDRGAMTASQLAHESMPEFSRNILTPWETKQAKIKADARAYEDQIQNTSPAVSRGDTVGDVIGSHIKEDLGGALRTIVSPLAIIPRNLGAALDMPADQTTVPKLPFIPPKGDFWDYKTRQEQKKKKKKSTQPQPY